MSLRRCKWLGSTGGRRGRLRSTSARCFGNDPLFDRRTTFMPMIDVYAPTDLFPVNADRQLAEELTAALLKAEGVANPGPTHTNNTGAYIHRMPPSTVNTAAQGSARTVRVQVVTRSEEHTSELQSLAYLVCR